MSPRFIVLLSLILLPLGSQLARAQTSSSAESPRVLEVGTYHGKTGGFYSIQGAANFARPGDCILIAPGVYHEEGSEIAGVLIETSGIDLRGMDRNLVIVDGTSPNPHTCSSNPADENFGTSAI
jgi:hypothetical protein